MSTTEQLDRATVAEAVKRVVIAESKLSITVSEITEQEPLVGDRLRLNSLGLLGMLLRIEDELSVVLSDDLFVGRKFHVVADLVDVVLKGSEAR
ncbi:hypothetical protein GCM10007079_25930 [Nocardiopsis terrae]|uniref:Acyl carrier protein n=1 Tax=Nocardiopsis terrae TaxID=372655 RepID=A0ABR9HFL6_9ACTN|nr:phosphopantetheine-binding protein [Nocardiopsis terrae]MBE1457803.1 acyl carrier protein [Nocardiopsis terrae]GHC84184.1 hypothetical protein GCM10007079_25930 [Nocardiopsis terrae]